MTEETKKPRRKRRTKAQIEADKAAAAELAAKEDNGRFSDPSSFAEEECIPCQESAMAALEAAEAAGDFSGAFAGAGAGLGAAAAGLGAGAGFDAAGCAGFAGSAFGGSGAFSGAAVSKD